MQKSLTTALLLAAAMMLAGDGYAQQTPASTSAATTPAAPAATTPKTATASKAAAKKVVQQAQQPGLLPSKEFLIEDAKNAEFKGTISVTAADADCRSVKYNIDVTSTGGPGISTDSFAVFNPGITFKFSGNSCIPAKGTQFTAHNDVNLKPGPGGMGLDHNRLVSTGPVIASGTVSMAMTQGAAVVEFTASSADPLVFQLTKSGYQYVSGTGTVKLPSGKVYTWTTSGGSAAMTQTPPAAATPNTATAANAPAKEKETAAKSASASLTTRKQKFSYALGMNIGTNLGNTLKSQSVEVDWDLVSQGLKDTTSGGKTRLTEEEEKAVLTEVQNEVRKEQAEKAKEASDKNKTEGEAFLAANKTKDGVVTLPSGLQYKILTAGTGPKPTASDSVVCNYRGSFINDKEFDSSAKHGKPATFPVTGVIKGWTEALQFMPVGSKWQLFVPSGLAYGEAGNPRGGIEPNTTLVFEVELLSIQEKPKDDKPKDDKTNDAGKGDAKPEEKKQ